MKVLTTLPALLVLVTYLVVVVGLIARPLLRRLRPRRAPLRREYVRKPRTLAMRGER
jgi:hypothetical protein